MLSGRKDNLVIHHIKTFGSGGEDDYCNMVTLNAFVHTWKVHWQKGWKYRKILEEYTSQFTVPKNWHIHKAVAEKEREDKNIYDRFLNKDKRKKIVKQKKDNPYIDKQKRLRNEYSNKKLKQMRKKNEQQFEAKYWMTLSQYTYRKQKEYLASKNEKKQ